MKLTLRVVQLNVAGGSHTCQSMMSKHKIRDNEQERDRQGLSLHVPNLRYQRSLLKRVHWSPASHIMVSWSACSFVLLATSFLLHLPNSFCYSLMKFCCSSWSKIFTHLHRFRRGYLNRAANWLQAAPPSHYRCRQWSLGFIHALSIATSFKLE